MASSTINTTLQVALGVAVAGQLIYTVQLRGELTDLRGEFARASNPAPRSDADSPTFERPTENLEHWQFHRPATAVAMEASAPSVSTSSVQTAVASELERVEQGKLERKAERNAEFYGELRELVQEHLGVPAEQADSLEKALVDAGDARDEVRRAEKAGELSRDEATDALRELRLNTQRQMADAMGADWQEKMDEARERMREARKKLQEARGAGGAFWFMSSE